MIALALTLCAPKPMAIPEIPPTASSGCTLIPITCNTHNTLLRLSFDSDFWKEMTSICIRLQLQLLLFFMMVDMVSTADEQQ